QRDIGILLSGVDRFAGFNELRLNITFEFLQTGEGFFEDRIGRVAGLQRLQIGGGVRAALEGLYGDREIDRLRRDVIIFGELVGNDTASRGMPGVAKGARRKLKIERSQEV